MTRVLLTGMSGAGKSAVVAELAARGFRAVDLDADEWSRWAPSVDTGPSPHRPGEDWVWREERVEALLGAATGEVLFVSGCAANQGKFHDRFDHIVLLSTPPEVMVERLSDRALGEYGGDPDERARSLGFKHTVEPLLRAAADIEVDASAPLEQVVHAVLTLVRR